MSESSETTGADAPPPSGSRSAPPPPAAQPSAAEADRKQRWRRRTRRLLIVLGLWLVGIVVGVAFLPRWWSHFIGDQVHGSIFTGIILGLFYGFAFTMLPLLVLWFAFRKRRPFQHWLGWFIAALAFALPNLLTLGIVVGTGNAAHAGERTLDVEAPAFRNSSLIGAVAAALVVGAWYWRGRLARRTAKPV